MKTKLLFVLVICASLFFSACSPKTDIPTSQADMPNPASVLCEANGGNLELRSDASGAVQGVCVFSDGSACNEWEFFHAECQPGDSLAAAELPVETGEPEAVPEGWKLYRNGQLGYTFQFPADADLTMYENMLDGLTITDPLVDDSNWPMFYVSHPIDNPEYHPTAGANLVKWLEDHYLLGEELAEEKEIAGITAVHPVSSAASSRTPMTATSLSMAGSCILSSSCIPVIKKTGNITITVLDSFQFD